MPEETFSGSETLVPRTGFFPTTRWTLIAAASQADPTSRRALGTLCEAYWYPVYACIRRWGHDAAAAEDLTQSFFVELLNGTLFARANPERGSFRAFLIQAIRFFLADEYDRSRALKRGGDKVILPIDAAAGERRYERESQSNETPERIFERRWAHTVLDRALDQLRQDFIRSGRLEHFRHLQPFLANQAEVPYAELAGKLEVTEAALKSAIHRLRKRYREALRSEVAATVADDSEVDNELRYLIRALSTKA